MSNIYLDNKIKSSCNGCGVCALICPQNCIKMIEDSEGFLYPEIDENKCIKCNKCRRLCSNNPISNEFSIQAYATKNKNNEQRKQSTSGGMFKILAEYVIERQGVVFGVEIMDDLKVVHDYAESMQECKKFSASKYVRSELNNSYRKVKEFLNQDRYVLFTGTPCQNEGLRKFLGKDSNKLILCEIICHANPSPKVFNMYIRNIENKTGKSVKMIYFRSKNAEMNNSSYIELKDGTKIADKLYNKAFSSKQLINRPSCYNCKFVDENRKADFTIGDFWGIENIFPDFNDNKGISLLTVNTSKAEKIFEEIKDKMDYKKVEIKKAFEKNHNSNVPINPHREIFFEKIAAGKINENNIIRYMKKYTRTALYKKVLNRVKNHNVLLKKE
ncbi:MAG: Coenzyme F420 hydrogenase/dehydrogenase, beta subunit C-terminal domain [Clostridia bacterium]|nr:Coenzyme F420 hydrogenase/dehydrogenase, beta subunit C-terminal domain [Clostridia bacterium]